jgi:glycosyltransferase involved in cell wall biosynthesis
VSAIVTTYNEAETISDCLDSLAWCDEILVVDSHSTDDTRAIARRNDRVRVIERPYFGAASQKNWAIDRCRFDWVLILDADERVTPELRREVETVLAAPVTATAFTIKRRTFALGKEIRYSGWQHDRVVRLFRRGAARYPNRRVHADMETAQPPRVLDAYLDHHMVATLDEYVERTRRYALWGAAQLWRDGRRRSGGWQIVVRPAWRFFRTYILQRGFLEGTRGFIMCAVPAYGTFLKYSTVWNWQRNHKRGLSPDLPAFDDDPATWEWSERKTDPAGLAPSY